jgi:uncharacterized membrane protein
MTKKHLQNINKTRLKIQEKTITLILGGFGLVAALAWNEAIKSLFEEMFEKRGTLISKFFYAFLITIIVVIISIQLQKISKKN